MQKKIQLPKEGLQPEDHRKNPLVDDNDVEGHRGRALTEPEGLIHRGPSTGGELMPQFPSTGGDVVATDDDGETGPSH
jgi:hypothetical protein